MYCPNVFIMCMHLTWYMITFVVAFIVESLDMLVMCDDFWSVDFCVWLFCALTLCFVFWCGCCILHQYIQVIRRSKGRERRSEERERESLSVNAFDTPVDVGNACLWLDSFAVLCKSWAHKTGNIVSSLLSVSLCVSLLVCVSVCCECVCLCANVCVFALCVCVCVVCSWPKLPRSDTWLILSQFIWRSWSLSTIPMKIYLCKISLWHITLSKRYNTCMKKYTESQYLKHSLNLHTKQWYSLPIKPPPGGLCPSLTQWLAPSSLTDPPDVPEQPWEILVQCWYDRKEQHVSLCTQHPGLRGETSRQSGTDRLELLGERWHQTLRTLPLSWSQIFLEYTMHNNYRQ